MPLLKLLQRTSAEVDEDHKDYDKKGISSAKGGDIIFTPEAKILPRPIEILPLAQKTLYAEWKPKAAGGGMVGHHPLSIVTDPTYSKGRNPEKPYAEKLGDNDLVLTIYFCVLFAVEGAWMRGILALTSTQLKHGRQLQTQIKRFKYDDPAIKPFIFSRSFLLESQKASSNENTWYEIKLTPNRVLDFTTDALLLQDAMDAYKDATEVLPAVQLQSLPVRALTVEEEPF